MLFSQRFPAWRILFGFPAILSAFLILPSGSNEESVRTRFGSHKTLPEKSLLQQRSNAFLEDYNLDQFPLEKAPFQANYAEQFRQVICGKASIASAEKVAQLPHVPPPHGISFRILVLSNAASFVMGAILIYISQRLLRRLRAANSQRRQGSKSDIQSAADPKIESEVSHEGCMKANPIDAGVQQLASKSGVQAQHDSSQHTDTVQGSPRQPGSLRRRAFACRLYATDAGIGLDAGLDKCRPAPEHRAPSSSSVLHAPDVCGQPTSEPQYNDSSSCDMVESLSTPPGHVTSLLLNEQDTAPLYTTPEQLHRSHSGSAFLTPSVYNTDDIMLEQQGRRAHILASARHLSRTLHFTSPLQDPSAQQHQYANNSHNKKDPSISSQNHYQPSKTTPSAPSMHSHHAFPCVAPYPCSDPDGKVSRTNTYAPYNPQSAYTVQAKSTYTVQSPSSTTSSQPPNLIPQHPPLSSSPTSQVKSSEPTYRGMDTCDTDYFIPLNPQKVSSPLAENLNPVFFQHQHLSMPINMSSHNCDPHASSPFPSAPPHPASHLHAHSHGKQVSNTNTVQDTEAHLNFAPADAVHKPSCTTPATTPISTDTSTPSCHPNPTTPATPSPEQPPAPTQICLSSASQETPALVPTGLSSPSHEPRAAPDTSISSASQKPTAPISAPFSPPSLKHKRKVSISTPEPVITTSESSSPCSSQGSTPYVITPPADFETPTKCHPDESTQPPCHSCEHTPHAPMHARMPDTSYTYGQMPEPGHMGVATSMRSMHMGVLNTPTTRPHLGSEGWHQMSTPCATPLIHALSTSMPMATPATYCSGQYCPSPFTPVRPYRAEIASSHPLPHEPGALIPAPQVHHGPFTPMQHGPYTPSHGMRYGPGTAWPANNLQLEAPGTAWSDAGAITTPHPDHAASPWPTVPPSPFIIRQTCRPDGTTQQELICQDPHTLAYAFGPAMHAVSIIAHMLQQMSGSVHSLNSNLSLVSGRVAQLSGTMQSWLDLQAMQDQGCLADRCTATGLVVHLLALSVAAVRAGRLQYALSHCLGSGCPGSSPSTRSPPASYFSSLFSSWLPYQTERVVVMGWFSRLTCLGHNMGLVGMAVLVLAFLAIPFTRHLCSQQMGRTWMVDVPLNMMLLCGLGGSVMVHGLGAAWLSWLILWWLWCATIPIMSELQFSFWPRLMLVALMAVAGPVACGLLPFAPAARMMHDAGCGLLADQVPWLGWLQC